jgi:FtsP/CotA-like multicopper oxidase with cupredoxin domain
MRPPLRVVAASVPWVLGTMLLAACAATSSGPGPVTRTYYIAADEVPWDYVPGSVDQITGLAYTDTAYFKVGKPRPVTTTYLKTLYREYTDSSFGTLKPRPPEWRHLGFLGPVIRGVVGDTIRVVFRNNGKQPYSVHPHGVFYGKESEGAPYVDGTQGADKADDGVTPGGTHVYTWFVPERAGPGPMDGSSIIWMYHSHVDETRDVNTGLVGPLIVTARGKARADGTPVDVDRELVTAYVQVHEEHSWNAAVNLPRGADSTAIANPHQLQNIYPWFVQFSINGYTHGALPLEALTIRKGQRVRWYVFASTNDFDGHSPHWHGNTVLVNQMRTDVLNLPTMGMMVADMVPDDIGTWLYHCHISMHLEAGMQARYAVVQ